MTDFTGRWFTSFGPMDLIQEGATVQGTYGAAGSIHGSVAGAKLTFQYAEPAESGEGWFVMRRQGKFSGEYVPEGGIHARSWDGVRGFDGIWDSSFGRMRIIQDE